MCAWRVYKKKNNQIETRLYEILTLSFPSYLILLRSEFERKGLFFLIFWKRKVVILFNLIPRRESVWECTPEARRSLQRGSHRSIDSFDGWRLTRVKPFRVGVSLHFWGHFHFPGNFQLLYCSSARVTEGERNEQGLQSWPLIQFRLFREWCCYFCIKLSSDAAYRLDKEINHPGNVGMKWLRMFYAINQLKVFIRGISWKSFEVAF